MNRKDVTCRVLPGSWLLFIAWTDVSLFLWAISRLCHSEKAPLHGSSLAGNFNKVKCWISSLLVWAPPPPHSLDLFPQAHFFQSPACPLSSCSQWCRLTRSTHGAWAAAWMLLGWDGVLGPATVGNLGRRDCVCVEQVGGIITNRSDRQGTPSDLSKPSRVKWQP